MSDRHSASGPQNTDDHKGENSSRDKSTGSTHSTYYGNNQHTSWDEDSKGNVSGVHTTDHSTGGISQNSTDNRGNPK